MSITQEQINEKTKEIYDKIVNHYDFVIDNYQILLKKHLLSGDEHFLVKQSKNNYRYQSPEMITYYSKIVAFYMSLEALGVPCENW